MGKKRRRAKLDGRPTMNEKRMKLNPQEDQTKLCDCCITMTTTIGGLCSLKSTTGYRHHNREELVSCAHLGCPFCYWTYSLLRHMWEHSSPGRLYIFAVRRGGERIDERNCLRKLLAQVRFDSTSGVNACLPGVWFKFSRKYPVNITPIYQCQAAADT